MPSAFRVFRSPLRGVFHGASTAAGLAVLLLALGLLLSAVAGAARAAELSLQEVRALHAEDGVFLSFRTDFELPDVVEDALMKGVPLYFVAEASLYRSRWYWRDRRVARVSRQWRLSYQPLMRRFRVNFGSLGQNYESLPEALGAIQRTIGWKLAESGQIEEGERHYVELDYRLDTSQLPRPFQFGIGGQADWQLDASVTVRLEDAAR